MDPGGRPGGAGSQPDGGGPRDTGWLLATARSRASDPELRTAAGFARRGPLPPVHRSQVGRWESGHTPAAYAVVRRYEQTLGLPRGQLTTTVDFMARRAEPLRVQPALPRPTSPTWAADTIDLVERAVSDEPMSGEEWDDLSALLAAHPEALLRGSDWERLLSRVGLEAATTTGLEYSLRAEASARLAGHPRSGEHLVELARRALTDPGTQVFETVGMLQYSVDPAGAAMLVGRLEDPDLTESARWAALLVLSALARTGRLDARHRAAAGAVAAGLLRDPHQPPRAHRSAATFIGVAGGTTGGLIPVASGLIPVASPAGSLPRSPTGRVGRAGSALADQEVQEVVDAAQRLQSRLVDELGPRSRWAPQLLDLVEAATQSGHGEERGLALEVLMLLPQGRVVGLACAQELRDAVTAGSAVLADDLLGRLSWLLQPDDVPTVLDLALDPAVDAVTAQQAAMALGNRRPLEPSPHLDPAAPTADQVASRVVDAARRHLRGGEDRLEVARGHLYVLGMYGRFDLLDELHRLALRQGATQWRRGAGWWLGLPGWARPAGPSGG